MARIEHAFLTAKECIGFFNESLSREKMEVARQQGAYPALVFTAVQVRLSKMTSRRQHSLLRVENSFVQVRCNQCCQVQIVAATYKCIGPAAGISKGSTVTFLAKRLCFVTAQL